MSIGLLGVSFFEQFGGGIVVYDGIDLLTQTPETLLLLFIKIRVLLVISGLDEFCGIFLGRAGRCPVIEFAQIVR